MFSFSKTAIARKITDIYTNTPERALAHTHTHANTHKEKDPYKGQEQKLIQWKILEASLLKS